MNDGVDVHVLLASDLAGVTYDEGMKRHKEQDKTFKKLRQFAKAANFGYAGGMAPLPISNIWRRLACRLNWMKRAESVSYTWTGGSLMGTSDTPVILRTVTDGSHWRVLAVFVVGVDSPKPQTRNFKDAQLTAPRLFCGNWPARCMAWNRPHYTGHAWRGLYTTKWD